MGKMEHKELIKELQKCLQGIGDNDFEIVLQRTIQSLMNYFDAECVGIWYRESEEHSCIEECHKDNSKELAQMVKIAMEQGNTESFIREVKAAGCDVIDGQDSQSVVTLAVVNPQDNAEDSMILSMLSEVLSIRISQQNLLERQQYESTHDVLTGLWNRHSYTRWYWSQMDTVYDSIGIVTTDVVHLAEINREFGYQDGDRKLIQVAEILKEEFASYSVYRYDEDEMLVLCLNIGKQDMELMVTCLREKLAELGFVVAMGYSWSASNNVRDLIAEAEVVMENDKLRLLHGTSASMRKVKSVVDEVTNLMERGRYLVYLQPKVAIQSGKTEGAEALVRQIDDALGVVGPGMFIPVLERYNIVHMIDLFVLKEVFEYQQEQYQLGHRMIPISVNFSKKTIMYPELIDRVCEMAKQYEVPDGMIHIEVTETIGDMDHVVIGNVADSLKALGFKLSMDDFGSHYSNLPVLIQYDFDSAKIDRSMVLEITHNHKSRILLEYMTSMINDLGIHCIVEGVETKEQVEILKETKAEMIQGFYFGKPVPKEEFYDAFMKAD
jgi:diguanylate cyclase (GGDEF)-like protein